MDNSPIIKIDRTRIKFIATTDIFINSIAKDDDLFPVHDGMTEEEDAELWRKAREFVDSGLPYCAPYSLKTGDMIPRRFEYKGKFIEFAPSQTGLPTAKDFDILLYCTSWVANAATEGRMSDIGPVFQMDVTDFLAFSGRGMGGGQYDGLVQALERLAGGTITTNTKPFGQSATSFHYIQTYQLGRDASGRLEKVVIELPHRFYFLIANDIYYKYHHDFYTLSPAHRLIYMFIKNYVAPGFTRSVSFNKLHTITGSTSPLRKFLPVIDDLAHSSLLEFSVAIDQVKEEVIFTLAEAFK